MLTRAPLTLEPSAPHLSSPSLCCSECHSLHGGGGGGGEQAQILVSKKLGPGWGCGSVHGALGVRPCAKLAAHVQNLTIREVETGRLA